MSTWPQWDRQVLVNIGAPTTGDNLRLLDVWHNCEGGLAAFNPLNTTQPEPAATNYNSVGVKNYPSASVGLRATVTTLENGNYNGIVSDLRAGSFTSLQIIQRNAHEFSTWGTSTGCLLSSVGGTPAPVPGPVTPPPPVPLPSPPPAGRPDAVAPHAHGAFHDLQWSLIRGLPHNLNETRRIRSALKRLSR